MYGSGSRAYLGLGKSNETPVSGLYLLNGEGSGLPKIDTLYDQDTVIGSIEFSNKDIGSNGYQLFVGQDDKIYITGSSLIMFGGNISEKSWIKIASEVEYFDPDGPGYINKSGELFVSGSHSDYLGLNRNTDGKVSEFTKVECFGENGRFGKAIKYVFSGTNSYVLSLNGIDVKLYGTGLANYNNNPTYPGWSDVGNKKEFVEILDDVKDFDVYANSTADYCMRVAITKNGDIYGWGTNWPHICCGNGSRIPLKMENCGIKGEDIECIKFMSVERCFVVSSDGNLYVAGKAPGTYDGGFDGLSENFVKYTSGGNGYGGFEDDEKIIDIAFDGSKTDLIILTNKGRLFGYGRSSCIGKGQGTNNNPIDYLGVDSVCSISGGQDFFVVVKYDGAVWGTGDNSSGVLGRWSSFDDNGNNTKVDSRYQSTLQWVECKELEY